MKNKKILMILINILIILMFYSNVSLAINDNHVEITKVEYTQEYKDWLKLSDEEKSKVIEPRKYALEKNKENNVKINNPLKKYYLIGASTDRRFSLKDVIPGNTKIRNQKQTTLCWAFSTLGTLETTLAMEDYKNSNPVIEYDFSEAHMAYATTRNAFLNDQVNQNGLTKDVNSFGNFIIAQNYLTDGLGAVPENDLTLDTIPKNIDISKIQNNNVQTTLYDTVELESEDKSELIKEIKKHITEYGGLSAVVNGANILESEFYNNQTGALNVDDINKTPDHGIVIIGWDDDYSKDNFQPMHRPQNNGAWIVKNSWGSQLEENLDEVKKENYETNKEEYNGKGIYDYNALPDPAFIEYFSQKGYAYNENERKFTYEIGDNGYMYVSYEDVNIYKNLWGIKKATNAKDYTNVYMNDLLGSVQAIDFKHVDFKKYMANVFNRETTEKEYLKQVSVYTIQDWKNCKVFVNPNGNDKSLSNLVEVKLKEPNSSNNSIDINTGFHTIEFAEPMELTGNSFVVVLQIEKEDVATFCLESKASNGWENAIVNENESFIASENDFKKNNWTDTALIEDQSLRGNLTLRAYTITESALNATLTNLEITKQPNKVVYNIGENFDKSGMEVTATYSDNSKKIVSSYIVVDGENLQPNKNFVTISFTDNGVTRNVTQPITVSASGESKEDKNPKSSDFINAQAIITDYVENSKISIKVSNIKIGDLDDTYTYYVALSGSQSISEVKDEYWIPVPSTNVKKEDNGTFTIAMDILLSDIKNINDLYNADNLYLNLKEIAEINGKQVQVVNSFGLTIDKTENNIEKPAEKAVENTINDSTVANSKLPNTGKINIIISVIFIIGIGVFCFIRYRNIDK